MTGTTRRTFQAQVTLDYLDGRPRRAERVFGWGRETVELGLHELHTGITCLPNYSAVGKSPHLTNAQLDELEQLLLQGATAHGWINDLWTYNRVAKVIRQQFGMTLSYKTVQRAMKSRMGWSCQMPQQQLKERDEEEIRRWKTEEFDRVKSEAYERNAYLAFADESGFMLAPTRRRTLAPRGRAPLN